jgi:catechol 2,3-dioxygenase-like lactoylglutathione lyase family enzyme
MISGGNATVYVSDFERAVCFYTEALGLKLGYRSGNEWATVEAGPGLTIGLHAITDKGPRPGTHAAIEIGFNVTEPIEKVVAVLQERGVEFRGPIVGDGPVKLASFVDPDGNPLYLCEVVRE